MKIHLADFEPQVKEVAAWMLQEPTYFQPDSVKAMAKVII
ncbi:hypothetical protein FACS1894216_21950 [Synergistales bacterium]|nr:hypothetical protein FACS1894216_21950 [Synergistales bacterium]